MNLFDVNDEGIVSLVDALSVISEIRRGGSRDLSGATFSDLGIYVDVNGDNLLTLVDALMIVHHLRDALATIGERAPEPPAPQAAASESEAELDTYFADYESEKYFQLLASPSAGDCDACLAPTNAEPAT